MKTIDTIINIILFPIYAFDMTFGAVIRFFCVTVGIDREMVEIENVDATLATMGMCTLFDITVEQLEVALPSIKAALKEAKAAL